MDDLMLPPKEVLDIHIPTGVKLYGYTADQMREYAKKAVEAAINDMIPHLAELWDQPTDTIGFDDMRRYAAKYR